MLVAANASPAIIPFLRVTSFSALHHSRSRVLPSPTSACRWSSTISSPREEVQEVSNSFAVGESLRKKQDGDNGLPKSVKKSTSPAAVSSGLDSSSDPSGGEGPKGKKAKSHFASHFDLNDARVKYPKKKRKTTQLARDDEGRPYSKPALGAHNEVHLLKRSINEGDRPATVLKKRKKSRPDVDAQTIKELIKVEGWQLDNWRDEWKMEQLASNTIDAQPFRPPHVRTNLPSYTRRVEGLLEPSQNDVLQEIEPPSGRSPIACLAHGLDRTLFNPGVHWVQDPRSRVYNFPPSIQSIPDISDFAFDRLTPFIKSSRDKTMYDITISEGKRFAGSTSSLSGLLSHIYFLISQDHQVDTSTLSKAFAKTLTTFTPGQRIPASVVFNHRDGVYLIDSDSTDNDDSRWNVLTYMGTMLEKYLTMSSDDFKLLLHSSGSSETEKKVEAYRYSKSNSFVMRSQLDCYDSRLPGTGVFDIKTRAALPIRLDNLNFRENSGYLIKTLHGPLESFEKEYYDLIRSAFLKYSFQARIGNMDGVFVAYHNTARMFGFQYVPLEEMDERLFGAKDRGWRVFEKCVGMLELIAQEIVDCFPGKTVTCLAETLENTNILRIWVQPVETETNDDSLPEISTDQSRPMIQLDVLADSYIDGTQVGGQVAVNSSDKPWTIHWSISRSSLSGQAIRRNFESAKGRKFRPYLFPTGVDSENVEDFLQNIGFGQGNDIPDIESFVKAGKNIELLRELSRAGLAETERREQEEKFLTKSIWQQPGYSDSELATLGITVATDKDVAGIDGEPSTSEHENTLHTTQST